MSGDYIFGVPPSPRRRAWAAGQRPVAAPAPGERAFVPAPLPVRPPPSRPAACDCGGVLEHTRDCRSRTHGRVLSPAPTFIYDGGPARVSYGVPQRLDPVRRVWVPSDLAALARATTPDAPIWRWLAGHNVARPEVER